MSDEDEVPGTDLVDGTSPADPNPEGSTLSPLGNPTTLITTPGEASPNASWASLQPQFPTVWPPTTPPPSRSDAGVVPWSMWLGSLAVRPYLTDPPPCPVVVSYYGYPFPALGAPITVRMYPQR